MDERYCYELLGVTKQSTDDELKAAYHKLAKQWHPDRQPNNPDAASRFKEIREAYDTIKAIREEKKKRHDRFIKIFDSVRPKQTKNEDRVSTQGKNIYTSVEISFEDSVLGCKKLIRLHKLVNCKCTPEERNSCRVCKGKGKTVKTIAIELKIPRGVSNKQTLKISGRGNVSENGGVNGDLHVTVNVRPHDTFIRQGMDITSKITVSYPEAVLGTKKVVPTVYGDVECMIPQGITHGSKLCLKGKGIINEDTGEVGDQYVSVMIDMLKNFTPEQERILMQLQKTVTDNIP